MLLWPQYVARWTSPAGIWNLLLKLFGGTLDSPLEHSFIGLILIGLFWAVLCEVLFPLPTKGKCEAKCEAKCGLCYVYSCKTETGITFKTGLC